jgi:hypothetical protein
MKWIVSLRKLFGLVLILLSINLARFLGVFDRFEFTVLLGGKAMRSKEETGERKLQAGLLLRCLNDLYLKMVV